MKTLENGITYENLVIKRILTKEYWVMQDHIWVRFRTATLADQIALGDSILEDSRKKAAGVYMLAQMIDALNIDDKDVITADKTTEEKVEFLKTLPAPFTDRLFALAAEFNNDITKFFAGEDVKKN